MDLSEKMLSWAEQRARREKVAERITFRQADVAKLPFADNRFDAVIAESVLAFVEDKEAALGEMIRVTKPGGYVGLNESFWTEPPPPEFASYVSSVGPAVLTEAEWRALWEAIPLEERTIQARPIEVREEVRDRIRWIGWRSLLPAWGRVIKLLLTKPGARQSMKEQLDVPMEVTKRMGYGLFVGRKPEG